jgi:hypothetical protein
LHDLHSTRFRRYVFELQVLNRFFILFAIFFDRLDVFLAAEKANG